MVGVFIYKSRENRRAQTLLKNIPSNRRTAEDFLQSATQALNLQENTRAIELAKEGIDLQSGSARTRSSLYNLLGSVLATQKNKKEALEQFQNAISADPEFSYPHSNIGNIYFMDKNFSEAEKSYLEAIRINPDHADAYNNIAILYKSQNRMDSAIRYFRKTLELDPNCKEARENLDSLQKSKRNWIYKATFYNLGYYANATRSLFLTRPLSAEEILNGPFN